MNQRKKLNSSKVNLVVSVIFHSLLVLVLFYFAAKEGILGKKMQMIAVTMVKEKKIETPIVKPPAPRDPVKVAETPKQPANVPAPTVSAVTAPPPSDAPVAMAPAAVITSDMVGWDEGRQVEEGDPNAVFKALVESSLRKHWNRPEGLADEAFVAEAELNVDKNGDFAPYQWIRGSGNRVWDDSVKAVLSATKTVHKAPPKGFPGKFTVRFDVETSRTEDVIQVSQVSQ